MKKVVMIYCGENGMAGKAEAQRRTDGETNFAVACCFEFKGQPEGDCAIIMPDVPSFRRDAISDAYAGKVEVLKDGDDEPEEVKTFGPSDELAAEIAAPIKRGRGRPRKVNTTGAITPEKLMHASNVTAALSVLADIPPIPDETEACP